MTPRSLAYKNVAQGRGRYLAYVGAWPSPSRSTSSTRPSRSIRRFRQVSRRPVRPHRDHGFGDRRRALHLPLPALLERRLPALSQQGAGPARAARTHKAPARPDRPVGERDRGRDGPRCRLGRGAPLSQALLHGDQRRPAPPRGASLLRRAERVWAHHRDLCRLLSGRLLDLAPQGTQGKRRRAPGARRRPNAAPSLSGVRAITGFGLIGAGYAWASSPNPTAVIGGVLPVTAMVSVGTYLAMREGRSRS